MIASLFVSIQNIGFFSFIRGSSYTYLAILSLHLAALALFGGMVVMTDLRLLGLAMRSYSISEIVNGFRIPKRIGLILAAGSGILLFASQAEQYSYDPWFWTKIALLLLLIVNYLIFRRGVYQGNSVNLASRAKLAAVFSLVLWTGVVCAGRGPATIKDIMHSMVDPSGDFLFESIEKVGDQQGAYERAPQTDAEWDDVRQRVAILQEIPNLVARRRGARARDRSRNPQSESQPEVIEKALDADRPNLLRRARRLQNTANLAMKAVNAKDRDALFKSLDAIDKACENCHLHYWYPNDKRAQEAAMEDGIKDSDTGAEPGPEPSNPASSK
jgi:hypothetical protein